MKIQERITSIKRHTIGYVIDSREFTRNEAVKLASRGLISNARVVKSKAYRNYLTGRGISLYSLPERFSFSRRFANKRSK